VRKGKAQALCKPRRPLEVGIGWALSRRQPPLATISTFKLNGEEKQQQQKGCR
jgi:hypothetical protein